jgi:hypothetical protein
MSNYFYYVLEMFVVIGEVAAARMDRVLTRVTGEST